MRRDAAGGPRASPAPPAPAPESQPAHQPPPGDERKHRGPYPTDPSPRTRVLYRRLTPRLRLVDNVAHTPSCIGSGPARSGADEAETSFLGDTPPVGFGRRGLEF